MNTSTTTQLETGIGILRISFGAILLAHGLLKIFGFTIGGTVGFFSSLGLPALAAYLTIFGEVAGGAALLIGAQTRLVAALSLPIMLGATWVHFDNGWLFSAPNGGWEFPALLSVISIVLVVTGGGRLRLVDLNPINGMLPEPLKS